MKLDRTEARVLGALIEKEFTTPEIYPLTIKALTAACNQKSNRDPVMKLAEFEIEGCLLGLRHRDGLARVVERVGSRTVRYSGHLADALGTTKQETCVLAELLLRGAQTPGELYRRCDRMARYEGQNSVDALLRGLAQRGLAQVLPRGPGQRYARWGQLLCTDGATTVAEPEPLLAATPAPAAAPAAEPAAPSAPPPPSVREDLAALRDEVATLRVRIDALEQRGSA